MTVNRHGAFSYSRKNQIIPNSKGMNNPHKVGIIESQNLLIVRRTIKQVSNFLLRHAAGNQILLGNLVGTLFRKSARAGAGRIKRAR